MNRLLKIADFVCGAPVRHRTFEPMLADWQRELTNTKRAGIASFLLALVSGCIGFIRALLFCAVCEGMWIPPLRGTLISLAAGTAAVIMSIGVLLIAPLPNNFPRDLSFPLVQRWVLVWSVTLVPPAFLLATFLLRQDVRATARHAIMFIALAVAMMSTLVLNTMDDALRRRFDTFDAHERMRAHDIATIQAGRVVYDGGRYQREIRTTVEERRARFERYRAQMDAVRWVPPITWSSRVTQWSPVFLALVFAIMGWMLAGFGKPTVQRGVAWWALMFTAIVTMTRLLSYFAGVPMPRPPQWAILPIFTSIMLALIVGARTFRKRQLR